MSIRGSGKCKIRAASRAAGLTSQAPCTVIPDADRSKQRVMHSLMSAPLLPLRNILMVAKGRDSTTARRQ